MASQTPIRPLPENKLDPRIKRTWRIADAIGIVLLAACIIVPLVLIANAEGNRPLGIFAEACIWIAVVVAAFVIIVLPKIRYERWRWGVTDEFLEIAKGIVWRRRTVIPFIRVQNTDTRQGPIMRAFGLADVTVSTAAGEHVIPGLALADAEALRDRAAELARIAREDV